MSEKTRKKLLIINVLTIAFILIQIQSMIAYINPENYYFYPFEEQLKDSFRLFATKGLSLIFLYCFGYTFLLTKFLLFFASIYAVFVETIGIVKKNLSPKYFLLILVKLLFIVLSLIRFETFITHLFSV